MFKPPKRVSFILQSFILKLPDGLMAATVQIVPLSLLHMQPVQRCLLSLGFSPQTPPLTKLWATRELCAALRWWRRPSARRVEAPSRGCCSDLARFGKAVADLFASRGMAHCPMFFSLGRDNPPLRTDHWLTSCLKACCMPFQLSAFSTPSYR